MNIIRLAIERPIAVLAMVLMTVMFGLIALHTIPVQLTPDVEKPIISVTTSWPGAAPAEIEREVVNRQEEVLLGLEGLDKMTSKSETGRGQITLEFQIDQDMDKALLLVNNRLGRVSGYPDRVDQPILKTSSSDDRPIAWFTLTRIAGNDRPIESYGDFVDSVVKDRIERVPGISGVNIFGGSEREIQITVDPVRMARYKLTVPQVTQALRAANVTLTAGKVDEGKRRYVVRADGELTTLERVRDVVLRSVTDPDTGRIARVQVGDIADVQFGYKEAEAVIRRLGEPAIAFNAVRQTGANVIETMDGLNRVVEELNATVLPQAGLKLSQVYDETVYINSSIDLVISNIWIGGTMAAIVLLLFLRSFSATTVVAMAIPVSVIGSFVAMAALGRSINVISLAGIAFAVGMVVDAAIVVLENIYRLRQAGRPAHEAAYLGASQVWGAVLVSALTTVLVFLPILVMKLEVGQLFRDIAVAISVSVLLSLLVAVTVIPALSTVFLRGKARDTSQRPLPGIDQLARAFHAVVVGTTRVITHSRALSFVVVALVCGTAATATWFFLPKMEYLPNGNRNLVFGIVLPPPGYNLETTTTIANRIEDAVRPHWASENGSESGPGEPPKMKHFFFVARRGTTFIGAASEEAERVGELIPVLRDPVYAEPGAFAMVTQPSLFGRNISGSRSIDVDISGPDLNAVLDVAIKGAEIVNRILPREEGHQFRPKPGLELGAPEVRIYPDRIRLADNGLSARDFSDTVNAFNDGLRVAEVTVDGERTDITLKGPRGEITKTQGIGSIPVVTASGDILPVDSLASLDVTSGPVEILHVERERTVTLEVRPSERLPLESAMDILQKQVAQALTEAGLPPGMSISLSGTADQLVETWEEMKIDLLLAIIIVYLVMAILYESLIYPLIIIFSVPLATAGGIAGLAVLNIWTYQPLDMLTLLGFVILIGIVVNNAILLVHQTLFHQREDGMAPAAAILEATRNRVRPIFMSTLTSVFGMMPLVLFPGAGSELYRGLGSVVIGGLSLSAVLTLGVIPPLLTLVSGMVKTEAIRKVEV